MSDHGWVSPRTVTPFLVSLVAFAVMARLERRPTVEPLIPPAVLRNRSTAAANGVAALIGSSTLGMFFLYSLYAQEVLHRNALQTGLSYIPLTVSLTAGSFAGPGLAARYGVRATVATGCFAAAAGILLMSRATPGLDIWRALVAPSLLVGPGLALTFVPTTMAAVTGVANADSGAASALVNVARTVGGAVGLAVVVTVAAGGPHAATQATATATISHSLTTGFSVAAALAAVAGAAAMVLFPSVASRPRERTAETG